MEKKIGPVKTGKRHGLPWERFEMILILNLYFQLPFGKLNHTNQDVRKLALLIQRTDNSVALRLTNFAACDPYILQSGRTGMQSGKNVCQPYWNKFANNRESLFIEAEKIKAKLLHRTVESQLGITKEDLKGLTRETVIKQRINQNVFRNMILNNYDFRCAITGINLPELLIASHIIPWAENEENRLNPENGICLSPLYDKAFDKGFIGISPEYRVLISKDLKEHSNSEFYHQHFGIIENKEIILPEEHIPNPDFLEYHLCNIFAKHN